MKIFKRKLFDVVDKLIDPREILRNTYIIAILGSFHKNLVTEIRKSPKIYFLDLGLRNSVINNFSEFDVRTDRGEIMENFVFRELVSNFSDFEVKFWRTTGKAEIDFILTKGDKIIPIEVKMSGKITRGFHSFLKTYSPERAVVVTLDKFEERKIGDTRVIFVPVWYF